MKLKKTLVLGLVCLTTLCGCGKIPKLQNGEEAAITFSKDGKEHKISAEELYSELKDNFGLQATIKMIDTYILETEFASYIDEAKKSAESYIKAMKEAYGEDSLLELIKNQTSYTSIDAFKEALYTSYMEAHALDEYAKTLVTDKEINAYYKDTVKGDVEIYQILIKPDVTDKMTDDEKKAKENETKEKIESIISELKKADKPFDKFKELVKEYSQDEDSKSKDGNIGYINYGDLDSNYDELLDAAYKLKDGEFSKSVITTELGYHVIYRNATKDKDKLEDIKDEIIEAIAKEKVNADSKLSVESIKYYRKLYNMEIVDSSLSRQYGIYMNNLLNQNNSENKKNQS